MKKIIFILSAVACIMTACNKSGEWNNLGPNPVEGIWERTSTTSGANGRTIIAKFDSDHTSAILYFLQDGTLEREMEQGLYRVEENFLIYKKGFTNVYTISEDGMDLTVQYGYGIENSTYHTYRRIETLPEPMEPEEPETSKILINH